MVVLPFRNKAVLNKVSNVGRQHEKTTATARVQKLRRQQQQGTISCVASTPEKGAYNSSNAGNSRMLLAGTENIRVARICTGNRDINGSENIDIDLIATARHLLQQSNREQQRHQQNKRHQEQ